MDLFIQIRDGQPYEHPILSDNFRQAFPKIDIDNLPPEFAQFERIPAPTPGVYELVEGPTYQWAAGVVKDVWIVRAMTAEERFAKQNAVKQEWAQDGFPSWLFVEETCAFQPPIPYPTDGKHYRWDESITNWVEVTLNQGA